MFEKVEVVARDGFPMKGKVSHWAPHMVRWSACTDYRGNSTASDKYIVLLTESTINKSPESDIDKGLGAASFSKQNKVGILNAFKIIATALCVLKAFVYVLTTKKRLSYEWKIPQYETKCNDCFPLNNDKPSGKKNDMPGDNMLYYKIA